MNIRNISTPVLYAVSALVVLALAVIFQPGETFLRVFMPIAFWTVVGLDFFRTQVKEDGKSEVAAYARVRPHRGVYIDKWGFVRVDYFGSPRVYEAATPEVPATETTPAPRSNAFGFADRFLSYLVTAPFIFPARALQFLRTRS